MIKRACQYCGRIHDKSFDCGKKPKRKYQSTEKDKYRSTKAWQRKREQVRDRDKNLCQICLRNLYDTVYQFNYEELGVHHIVPLEEDYELRDDERNLITLCEKHHKLAEKGVISRDFLQKIVEMNEEMGTPQP